MCLNDFSGRITHNDIDKYNEVVFSTGLRFLWLPGYGNEEKLPIQIIGSEIGYRNDTGRNKFYFNINIDLTIAVTLAIVLIYEALYDKASEIRESNEDYEKNIIPQEPKMPKNPFLPKEPKGPYSP